MDSVVFGNRWPLWALQSENESLTRNDLFAAAAWENGRLIYAQGAAGELSLRAVAKHGSMIYVEEAGSNRLQLSGGRPRHRVGRINVQRPNQVEWWGDARPAFDQTLLVCAETAQSAVIERRPAGSAVHIRSMKEAPSPRRSQTR